jgi:hypothetical protein
LLARSGQGPSRGRAVLPPPPLELALPEELVAALEKAMAAAPAEWQVSIGWREYSQIPYVPDKFGMSSV